MSSASAGAAWRSDLEAVTRQRIAACAAVAGGDIGQSFRVSLESGEQLFVKHYRDAPAGQTRAEAEGLRWLAEPKAIRVAEVAAVGRDWLALHWIESGPPAKDHAEQLGRRLAALHAAGAPQFGYSADNWIGRIPQANHPTPDWPSFYRERRLQPLIERAARAGRLGSDLNRQLETLILRLPDLVGPEEAPARLHGDLWSGNVHCDERGAPCLIDPACYGGHREVDLAMMRLFGGFGAEVFEAYEDSMPLAPGAETRVGLYQVYPLLVHLCLFGDAYRSSLAAAVGDALKSRASIPRAARPEDD